MANDQPRTGLSIKQSTVTCRIEGCDRNVRAKALCQRHYNALIRNCDPLIIHRKPQRSSNDTALNDRRQSAIAAGVTHTCGVCRTAKPVQSFAKSGARKDGYTNRCLDCIKAYDRQNPRVRAKFQCTPIEPHGSRTCKDCQKTLPIEDFTKNSEYALGRTYQCRDCNNIYLRGIRPSRPQKARDVRGQWQRDWRKTNPERVAAYKHKRRAIESGSESFTAEDVQDIHKAQKGRCAYCRAPLGQSQHIDHIQPLIKSRDNRRSNIQLTCASCNIRKNARDPIDFARDMGLLL